MGEGERGDGSYDARRHTLNRDTIRRDTVLLKENSWVVIRFIGDNPGVWAFHWYVHF